MGIFKNKMKINHRNT